MNIKYINTILSNVLFLTNSFVSPVRDSYSIYLPEHLDLSESGSFDIGLNGQLETNDTISIDFENTFVLSDKHGKNDITGSILNPNISFDSDTSTQATINYEVYDASVGEWSGNLGLTITLETKAESNLLIDGTSINEILTQLNPTTITFSHDIIDGNYLFDLSLAKDESILLYQNGNEVIITNKINKPIIANEDMSNFFKMLNIQTINNLNYLDTSRTTNMSCLFQNCQAITSLDVSSLNTGSVTDLSYAFATMNNLNYLYGLENFDVENVTTFSHLLDSNKALKQIPDLSGWNVSDKCVDISYMMNSIGYTTGKSNSSIWPKNIDYSNWTTSNITNMERAFSNCFSCVNFKITGWDTSSCINMAGMFRMQDAVEKSKLARIEGIEDFNVNNVIDMSYMFYECRSLSKDNDFSLWTPYSIENLSYAFYNTRSLNLKTFENWYLCFDENTINKTECFGSYAGYLIDKTYKPEWSK